MRQHRGERLRSRSKIRARPRLCECLRAWLRLTRPSCMREHLSACAPYFRAANHLASFAPTQVESWSRAQSLVEFRSGRVAWGRPGPGGAGGGGAGLRPSAPILARQGQKCGVLSLRAGCGACCNDVPRGPARHLHRCRRPCRRGPAQLLRLPVPGHGAREMGGAAKEVAQRGDRSERGATILTTRGRYTLCRVSAAISPRRSEPASRAPRLNFPRRMTSKFCAAPATARPGRTGRHISATHPSHLPPTRRNRRHLAQFLQPISAPSLAGLQGESAGADFRHCLAFRSAAVLLSVLVRVRRTS